MKKRQRGDLPLRPVKDHYTAEQAIGAGTTSTVYIARPKSAPDERVAVKKLCTTSNSKRRATWEADILARLGGHENIIRVIEVATETRDKDRVDHFLILECMQHDLGGLLHSHHASFFTHAMLKSYILQMMRGIAHCHAHKVIHCDLKPENLLIAQDGTLKLADFGLAAHDRPECKGKLPNPAVTSWYRPPEICLGSCSYGVSADIWSAACIVVEILGSLVLFRGESEEGQIDAIVAIHAPRDWPDLRDLPRGQDFAARHWPPERGLRNHLQGEAIPAHRRSFFTRELLNLVEAMLQWNPTLRVTAGEVLAHAYVCTESPAPYSREALPRYQTSYFGSANRRRAK